MTFAETRNLIWERLQKHVGCPVVLSDQIQQKPTYPYGYYSILIPRATNHSFGLKAVIETPEGYTRQRAEPVSGTMSFTFCSMNRNTPGGYIYGEDEALELAEKAHGFFLLSGHNISAENGDIVIQNVGAVANRSELLVTDTVRRYGFDIRFGYVRIDEMPTEVIEKIRRPQGQLD